MINKRWEAIDKADIDSLIENEVAESRTLEYKEKLPGSKDSDDKRELLKDVSGFANASGGDLLYGISEQRDSKNQPTGLYEAKGLSDINTDQVVRQLEDSILTGIDPRIPGVIIKPIDGFADGPVIIIRVPKSWNSPHMVKNTFRFYVRRNASTTPLDVTEIRSAFIASESLAERIRQFRADRIAKFIAGEGPTLLPPGPKVLMHIIPISAFSSLNQIDVNKVALGSLVAPGYSFDPRQRFNLDGILSYKHFRSEVSYSYVQLFRNGSVEAAFRLGFPYEKDGKEDKLITGYYETQLVQALEGYLSFLQNLSISPPVIVFLTLTGVRGYRITRQNLDTSKAQDIFVAQDTFIHSDRDILIIPEISIEDYGVAVEQALKPSFDTIWQAFGRERSCNYDESGNWEPRR